MEQNELRIKHTSFCQCGPVQEEAKTGIRAAIYLHISLDREMDGLAIDRQREDCENLAKYRRWEVVETYVD